MKRGLPTKVSSLQCLVCGLVLGGLVLGGLTLTGCNGSAEVGSTPPGPAADDGHDHSHGHAHAHTAGPHGGHIVELGKHEYHAEWLHDDESGLVTVFILDADMKEEVPIAAEQISIAVTIGAKSAQHQLEPAGAGDDGRTAQFELANKSLIEALKMAGEGAEATLRVQINGKPYVGKFEHDDHAGHSH